jgi:lipid-binding SYLF domain-containing protein
MRIPFVSALLLACMLGACSTPKTAEQKKTLAETVQTVISDIKFQDPTVTKFFTDSYGYAVLPAVGKGGFIISGAGGDGEVWQGGKLAGYCTMGQASIGATVGGQGFNEFIFFKDKATYDSFVAGKFAMAAQASAVVVSSGAGAAAGYQNGVAVFVSGLSGAMLEASIGGQNFKFVPASTPAAAPAKK